jgi:hypothetical protein
MASPTTLLLITAWQNFTITSHFYSCTLRKVVPALIRRKCGSTAPLILTSVLHKVEVSLSCFCHFTLGKVLLVPTEYKIGWIPELVCTLWRRETLLLLPEMEVQFLSCPTHSLVAILTPILVPFSSTLMSILFNYTWKIQNAHLIFKSSHEVMERRIIWSKCQSFIQMLLEHIAIFNLFSHAQKLTTTTNSNSKPFVCFSIWFI